MDGRGTGGRAQPWSYAASWSAYRLEWFIAGGSAKAMYGTEPLGFATTRWRLPPIGGNGNIHRRRSALDFEIIHTADVRILVRECKRWRSGTR